MASAPKKLAKGQAPITTPGSLYTRTATGTDRNGLTVIEEIHMVNVSPAGRSIELWHDDDGSGAINNTKIYENGSLATDTTVILQNLAIYLEPDSEIFFRSDAASSVVVTLYGVEQD